MGRLHGWHGILEPKSALDTHSQFDETLGGDRRPCWGLLRGRFFWPQVDPQRQDTFLQRGGRVTEDCKVHVVELHLFFDHLALWSLDWG